ncbi:hypothetical protein D3C84_959420 [compost metagenome]
MTTAPFMKRASSLAHCGVAVQLPGRTPGHRYFQVAITGATASAHLVIHRPVHQVYRHGRQAIEQALRIDH